MSLRLCRPGDLNAFFGLMLDNLTQLVILTGILVGVFGFPKELVLTRIIPGSAAKIIDHELRAAAGFLAAAGVSTLFGVIHSPFSDGRLFWPWQVESFGPIALAVAYLLMAGILSVWGQTMGKKRQP